MAKWIALCNGGPNDTTVGSEEDSLGKAIGRLESMMKNLHATMGYIMQKGPGQNKIGEDYFVSIEAEAGHEDDETEA